MMKKIFSVVAIAAFMMFAGKANAQFSLHAGYQSQAINSEYNSTSTSTTGGGFYVGATYNYDVKMLGLGVAPGLYFGYTSTEMDLGISKKTYGQMDLRIPVLLTWGTPVGDVGIAFFAGPNFNIGLGGDVYDKDKGNMKGFDIGLTFGGKLSYQSISVDLGYNMGLMNRTDVKDYTVKFNQFFVGLGYSF